MGSGGGSVGRAVATDTKDPRFKSQHRQFFLPIVRFNVKDKNKEKETGKGPSLFEKECFVGND